MRTRGLKLVVNSEGILKTQKTDVEDYKRKKLRKIYAGKIKESLLNTLNDLINYYKHYNNPELPNSSQDGQDNEDNEHKVQDIRNLISKIRSKFDNSYEDYVTNISNRICNRCYDEYSSDERTLKRKLFEITSNVKRVNNCELREKILLNQISVSDLIKLEIVELAPEEVKNQRKAQVENHYIRNVILNAAVSNNSSPQSAVQSPDKELSTAHSQASLERNKLDTIENLKEFFLNSKPNYSTNNYTSFNNSSTVDLVDNKDDNDDKQDNKDDKDEGLVGDINTTKIRNELIINDDENESLESDSRDKSVKLAIPPNVTQFKYETISLRLANRINSLPNSFRRPFLDNFRQATRRLEILMKRSSILTGKLSNC